MDDPMLYALVNPHGMGHQRACLRTPQWKAVARPQVNIPPLPVRADEVIE